MRADEFKGSVGLEGLSYGRGCHKPLLSTPMPGYVRRIVRSSYAWWADSAAEARQRLNQGDWYPDENGDPVWRWHE